MFSLLRRTKVIAHNVSGLLEADDPSFPYKAEALLAHPDFHRVAFIIMFGSCEELIVRAKSLRALNRRLRKLGIRTNSRLEELVITGPQGEIEHLWP